MRSAKQTIYIKNIGDLEFWTKKFKRIYFGNEFCPNLIPTPSELKIAMDFATKRNLGFSLLTCQVNDVFLEKTIRNLSLLRKGDELIINDWGLLSVVSKRFKNLLPYCVFGKFITNNINLIRKDSRGFLKQYGFSGETLKRVELDINTAIERRLLDRSGAGKMFRNFKVSLYYPYSCFAATRLCPTAYCDSLIKPKNYRSEFWCNRECQRYTFLAKHPTQKTRLILKGNAWFLEASLTPFFKKNSDRLVFMPTIPV